MASLYSFLIGPGLILSLLVFLGGMIWRVVWYVKGLDWQLDRVAYQAHLGQGIKGALHSALMWLLPYKTHAWRQSPFFALAFFVFHLGAVLVPLFLAGHAVLLRNAIGFSLPSLPQGLADVLTIGTLLSAVFLLLRRIALPEVRIVSTRDDYGLLIFTAVPFLTGFLAACHAPGYNSWLLLHIISGELLLVLAPFTRLSHIVLYFMSRGQLGMDFSIKRGGDSRGPCFPW